MMNRDSNVSSSSSMSSYSSTATAPNKPNRKIELKDFRRQQTIDSDPLYRRASLATDVSLAWRNLCYEVKENPWTPWAKSKQLLRSLTGNVKYRSLNGFMGPSGAGKTTLLSCLNGDIRQLASCSEMYVNDDERTYPDIGFIEQHVHENIVGGLTVREVLYYAFRFKNRQNQLNRLDMHIKDTIDELLLDPKILDRPFQVCSGGEQKRIAIAQELMSLKKPTFLFIDEPTTGLDSQAALLVMQCLRRITTDYSITLMVSIHMPNDEMIRMFDQLYILAKGGVCIYAGRPIFLRQNLRQRLGKEIEPGKPPIEEYLKIACSGIEDENVRRLAEYTLHNENEKLKPYRNRLRYLESGMPRKYKRFTFGDFFIQLCRLCYIVFIVQFRLICYQLLVYTGFFIFMATIFPHRMIHVDMCYPKVNQTSSPTSMMMRMNETCQEHRERNSLSASYINYQAFCVMFYSIINLTAGSILFRPLLKVFRNEHQNRCYSMSTFYWSFIAIRLIEMTFFALVITCLMYFSIGHHYIDQAYINWSRFGYFFLFHWMNCLYLQSIGQLLSLFFLEQAEVSIIAAQVILIVLSLVNGNLITLSHVNNQFLIFMSDMIGTKYLAHGLLYAFFILDRCDLRTHVSLKFQSVVGEILSERTIFQDLNQVIINIIILRTIGILMMYIRFSWNLKINKWKLTQDTLDSWQTVPIDSSDSSNNASKKNSLTQIVDLATTNTAHREKEHKELQFEEFVRDKIIVGWRSLTLFGNRSIREIRSAENVDHNTDHRLILRDLNGQFKFGTLNALMGTSGAGKTSFLKVLNGRSKIRLSDETEIYLSRYTPIRICYLTQEVSGHLWPGLTAKQSLIYASKLKNSFEQQQVDHEKIAMTLLEELDILDTANTIAQNCSGGEKKRLALAQELTSVRMPNFICIDEPTSGLDSYSADVVVKCLRNLVRQHSITIVASIHQPTTEMLMLFDYCYVLARGGVCIYSDNPNQIPQHLIDVPEVGWSPETDKFPVEELIKCSCKDYRDDIVQKLTQVTKAKILKWDADLVQQTQKVVDGIQLNRIRFSIKSVCLLCTRYSIYVRNYLWLPILAFSMLYLSYGAISRIFFDKNIAYTSGCVNIQEEDVMNCEWSEEQIKKQVDLINNIKYSLFYNSFFLFLVVLQAALFFSKESINFFNEHRNGWYSAGAFYSMKTIFDLLPLIPISFLYVYMINIYEPVRPGIYWSILLLLFIGIIAMQSVGHITALMVSDHGDSSANSSWNQITVILINITYFFIVLLLANFFNPIKQMHYIYQFVSTISLIRWINEANTMLQYAFGRCIPRKEIQVTIHYMMIPQEDEYFYFCVQMMIFTLILYRIIALVMLISKANPMENRRQRAQRILRYHDQELSKASYAIIPGLSSHVEFAIKKIEVMPERYQRPMLVHGEPTTQLDHEHANIPPQSHQI